MKPAKKKIPKTAVQALRTKKGVFSLNDEEDRLLEFYMKKYKIKNKSRWFRETIVGHVLKTLDRDYPTLFDENEMRR